MHANESFAFETTLATRSYKSKILQAKEKGYNITLLFFWLNNVELAKERVETRVKEGGHNIPTDVIERRYRNGIQNLFDIYLDLVDIALIFDNSLGKHERIAQKIKSQELEIFTPIKFNYLKEQYERKR